MCVCVCVDFVKCGFLYVWNLRSVGVCMCGSCEFWSCVCVDFGKCMCVYFDFVECGLFYVCNLLCVRVCMCGFCELSVCVCGFCKM